MNILGNTIIEKLYCILNKIEPPKCIICNNSCKFVDFNFGYIQCCSTECSRKLGNIKRKQTNIKKYRN